jgi:excisionase family DNA binding protein
MSTRLLTAAEVAELLAVPTSWVYEQSRAGRIPTVALGRYRRFREEAIAAWIEQLEPAPGNPPPEGRPQPARGQVMARRSYGSGLLTTRRDANGTETWYGW